METTPPFYKVPDELIHIIAKYLNSPALVSFSQTCKRFSIVFKSMKISKLNFENNHDNGLLSISSSTLARFLNFLGSGVNPSLLKTLNLNGVYWMDLVILEAFLTKCHNLEKLEVAETGLTIDQIVTQILPDCSKVTSLSFTMKDWHYADFKKDEALKKLISVEIITNNSRLSDLIPFLNKCTQLEKLVVSMTGSTLLPIIVFGQNGTPLGPFSKLKSFIFVHFPPTMKVRGYQHEIDMTHFQEQRQMTTFWSNVLDIPYPNSELELFRFNNLSWNFEWNSPDYEPLPENRREQVRLPTLRSVWEPSAVFMQSPESSPQLKLVNCVYDGLNFHDFCLNHQLIEVLKLSLGKRNCQDGTVRATASAWTNESWKMLQKLRILSLDAALIALEEVENGPYHHFMLPVTSNCLLIQELEIMGSGKEILKVEELMAIGNCCNLKRLLLSNFMVANGQFLETILKGCPLLECLRLKKIGPSHMCCYTSSLVTSLKSAENLRTFCVYQEFMDIDFQDLLNSVKQCKSLSRVSLIALPKVAPNMPSEMSRMFLDFCDNLKQLVVLFCVLNVPSEACRDVNTILRTRFRGERPAFCVEIKSSAENCQSYELPFMHSDVIVHMNSNVAHSPFGHDSILQRLF